MRRWLQANGTIAGYVGTAKEPARLGIPCLDKIVRTARIPAGTRGEIVQ